MNGEKEGGAQSTRAAIDAAAANERNRRLQSGERNVPTQDQMSKIYRDSVRVDEVRRERK